MFAFAKFYFLVFGLVTIAGGLTGFLKAGSKASLIAGAISGALLLLAAYLVPVQWKAGLGIALVVSLALAGRFLPALLKGAYNPSGYIVPLAIIGIIVSVLGLFQTPAS